DRFRPGSGRFGSVAFGDPAQPVERRLIEPTIRAESYRQPKVGSSLAGASQLLEALPQRVVRVVRGWVDVQQELEGFGRPSVLSAVVVGAPERLQDGPLARLQTGGARENGRSLRVMACPHQLL